MTPLVRIRSATRAALRRRYGFAALRVLRRGVREALKRHHEAQFSPRPYSTPKAELVDAWMAGIRRLRRRWPNLNLLDPRGQLNDEGATPITDGCVLSVGTDNKNAAAPPAARPPCPPD